jgi:hypothetical protein
MEGVPEEWEHTYAPSTDTDSTRRKAKHAKKIDTLMKTP